MVTLSVPLHNNEKAAGDSTRLGRERVVKANTAGTLAQLVDADAAVVVHLDVVQHVLRLLPRHRLPQASQVREQLRLADVPVSRGGGGAG